MNSLIKPTVQYGRLNFLHNGATKRSMRTNPTALKKELPVVNPANGEIVKVLPCDTQDTVNAKFQQVSQYQKEWRNVPFTDKKRSIEKFSQLLLDNVDDLAKTLTSEMGKPISQARNEVKGVIGRINYFLENVQTVTQPRIEKEKGNIIEQVKYEPLGVVANVSAWNYPYFVGANVFVPALLTGNTVIYKPSEYASLTGLKIDELLKKSGIPDNAFTTIIGRGDVGEMLLNKEVDGVFFTGSNATGAKIAKQVAGRMIRVQLELGGKDPSYVCDDADPTAAAKSLADGAMYNTGQSCCSVERIYVHSSVYKQFLQVFVDEVKGFKMGDPMSDSTYIGALALSKQADFLEAQVKDAVSKGAQVVVGGKKGDQASGHYFQPTVLTHVNHDMELMREESFGPIIGIQEVKSDEEAIKLMNDTKYGLTAGVYTKTKTRAEDLLSQINSGSVYWNACDRVAPALPWSGRKGSGIGSTLGRDGIMSFVQPKGYHLIGN